MSTNKFKTAQIQAFCWFISALNAKKIVVHSIVYDDSGVKKTVEVENDLYRILDVILKQKSEDKGYLVYHSLKYPNLAIGQNIYLSDLSGIIPDEIDLCDDNPLNMTANYEQISVKPDSRELSKFYDNLYDINSEYTDRTQSLLENLL